jgi:DNA-binding CsgD family transcriptional regulator
MYGIKLKKREEITMVNEGLKNKKKKKIRKLSMKGKTAKEIAEILGVSLSSVYKYR